MAQPRVLLVTHELTFTGAPRLALEALKALGSRIDLRVISYAGGGLEGEFRQLGNVDILAAASTQSDSFTRSSIAKAAARLRAPLVGFLQSRWNPDVIFVNSVAAITLVPRLRLGDISTLIYVHELDAALGRMSDRHRSLLEKLPDRYIAVSTAVSDDLIGSRHVRADRVSVIPPSVNLDQIDQLSARPAPPPNAPEAGQTFLIGGAGNPHWTKGLELWLLMAREVTDLMGPGVVEFEWVGVRDNHVMVDIRAMIRKLDLVRNVRLVKETANPYPSFSRFDVFAMTSWEESASLVVLENMALKVPVVCFAGSDGPPEQLGGTGIVIERFSPRDMAIAIAELLADEPRREIMGARERARVADVNAPGRIGDALLLEIAAMAMNGAG